MAAISRSELSRGFWQTLRVSQPARVQQFHGRAKVLQRGTVPSVRLCSSPHGSGQSRVRPADWGYVLAPGAGVDIRLTDKFTLPQLQVDWILPCPLRVSSGFAFRFGHLPP